MSLKFSHTAICSHLADPTANTGASSIAGPWVGELSTGLGRVDTVLWVDPPLSSKGLNRSRPQILPRLTPRAPEVTQTQNSAKNERGIFGISALGGSEKSVLTQPAPTNQGEFSENRGDNLGGPLSAGF